MHPAVRGLQLHGVAVVAPARDRALFQDLTAQRLHRGRQSPHQPARVDHRGAALVQHPTDVRRGVDHRPRLLGIEQDTALTEAGRLVVHLAQTLELPRCRRHIEAAGALEGAVDPIPRNGFADRVEIGVAEPQQLGHLIRPTGHAVAEPMGQARRAETAVATGGRPAQSRALQDHDLTVRVLLEREQRRPETGEATADDREVAAEVAVDGRPRRRTVRPVQPQRCRAGPLQSRRRCDGPRHRARRRLPTNWPRITIVTAMTNMLNPITLA